MRRRRRYLQVLAAILIFEDDLSDHQRIRQIRAWFIQRRKKIRVTLVRASENDGWKHYPSIKVECDPPQVATPSIEFYKQVAAPIMAQETIQ